MERGINDEGDMRPSLEVTRKLTREVEEELEAMQITIRSLNHGIAVNTIPIDRALPIRASIEKEIRALLAKKVALHTSLRTFAGRYADGKRWNKDAHAADWAHLDSLHLQFERQGPPEPRVPTYNFIDPTRWRQAIFNAYYSAEGNEFQERQGWCPIAHKFFPIEAIEAVHIVREDVTEVVAQYLFGPADDPSGHILSTRNGMPMATPYKALLRDAKIAIVPTKDGSKLMVCVLDEAMRTQKLDDAPLPLGQKLHGRILTFTNHHRPLFRNLLFASVMNLLVNRRYEQSDWWKSAHIIPAPVSHYHLFPASVYWIKEATLQRLAVKVGLLDENKARVFAAKIQPEGSRILSRGGGLGLGMEDDSLEKEKDDVFTSYLQYVYQG